jgi:hypothetical protein
MVEGEDEKKLHEVARELVELVKKHIGSPLPQQETVS